MAKNPGNKPTSQKNGFLTDSTNASKIHHKTRMRVMIALGIILLVLVFSFALQDISNG